MKNERKYDLVVFRCKGCIEDLEEYNPYVYPDGTQIPYDKIERIEVPQDLCENNEINLDNHWMISKRLTHCSTQPWLLKLYETENDRREDYYSFNNFETFHEALNYGIKEVNSNNYDSFEICLRYKEKDTQEITIDVYRNFSNSNINDFGFYQIQ